MKGSICWCVHKLAGAITPTDYPRSVALSSQVYNTAVLASRLSQFSDDDVIEMAHSNASQHGEGRSRLSAVTATHKRVHTSRLSGLETDILKYFASHLL